MHLFYLILNSASESTPVHGQPSRQSQVWRTAEPIQIQLTVWNRFSSSTSYELVSQNSIQFTWSTYTAFELGLSLLTVGVKWSVLNPVDLRKDTTVCIDFLKSKRKIKAMVCAQNNFYSAREYINALLVCHTREKRSKLLSSVTK